MINGKYYIGLHSTNILDDGYMGSGKKLREDITLLGVDKFIREILYYFETREEAFRKEAELVNRDFVKNELTYNLIQGGIGCIYPNKTKSIYSHSKKIRPVQVKEEVFEKYNEKCFYNISYQHSGTKEEIFERVDLEAMNKIKETLEMLWYEKGPDICHYVTKMINNKFKHKEGIKYLKTLMMYPVIRSELRLSKTEWGQLNMFSNVI